MEDKMELVEANVEGYGTVKELVAKIEQPSIVKPKTIKLENLISFDQLVDLNLLKKSTIYYFTSKKLIPFYKIGRRIFFDRGEISDWIINLKENRK